MGKLRNIIDRFSYKNIVVVSDYAADLGAKHRKPSRTEIKENRFLKVNAEKLAPKYEHNKDGLARVEYEAVQGFAPNITLVDYGFEVNGGILMYHNKYVMFPQRRVAKDLSDHLTSLVQKDASEVNENVFYKIEHFFMHTYGDDAKNNVKQSFYYFQGNPYCLRLSKEKQYIADPFYLIEDVSKAKDVYQWYRMAPVVAHYQGSNIQCDDVLFADHSYDEHKFVDDLRDSTILGTTPGAEQLWREQVAAQKLQENEKNL